MDILNWLFIRKQNLIKEAPNSQDDLVMLGANVTFAKRGDKYKSYAVALKNLITKPTDAGIAGSLASPITFGNPVTLNGNIGSVYFNTTGLLPGGGGATFIFNDIVTWNPGNKIMLSIDYNSTDGCPVAWYSIPNDGQILINIFNAHPTIALNTVVRLNFEVLPI